MATKLSRVLEEKGWTQAKLAMESGISPGQISLYCTGRSYPNRKNAYRIAATLGAEPKEIFGRLGSADAGRGYFNSTPLKRAITDAYMTYGEVADATGLYESTIANLARNSHVPNLNTATRLSRVLNKPIGEIFPGGVRGNYLVQGPDGRSMRTTILGSETALARHIVDSGKSLREIADSCKLRPYSLAILARGRNKPYVRTALRLAAYFNERVDILFPDGTAGASPEKLTEIYLRRTRGETLREIGDRFGISRERVRQVLNNIERM